MAPEKDNLTTGDTRIDFEHAQIIITLVKLEDATLDKASRITICENLLRYITEHCEDEELLMGEYNYPDKNTHIQAHALLQEILTKYINQFIKYDNVINYQLKDTFINHIINMDLPMFRYIKDNQNITC